jgi:putative glycosyltransferase (TIGR04372 family)
MNEKTLSEGNKTKIRPTKIGCFFQSQAKQIRQGGWPVLLRKGCLLLTDLISILFSLPVVLIIRLLRPLVVVRLGPLLSSRLGHFAIETEMYLCDRDKRKNGSQPFDIFYHRLPICNHQLKKMWDRTLRISRLARWPDRLNRKMPGAGPHVIPRLGSRDIHGLIRGTPAHLSFTADEEHRGREALRAMGVQEGVSFICIHARDSSYLEAVSPERDWRYHDYRDSSIHNYVPAAEELVRRGHVAVRVGAIVKERLAVTNPGIVDYASNGCRSDFLDIYLGAKCRFFLCSATGVSEIPRIFRRPIAFVNFIPLEDMHTWGPDDLLIPKKLWLKKERRFLTFPEIFALGCSRFFHSEQYGHHGIEAVENTPQEILEVAIEMDERLKGAWKTTEEDEELQQRFWSCFRSSELHGDIVSRVGTEFLRRNRELLAKEEDI